MSATLFLSRPHFPFIFQPFSGFYTPLSFSSIPLFLKAPKLPSSLSSDASTFFLQNPSLTTPIPTVSATTRNRSWNDVYNHDDEDANEPTSPDARRTDGTAGIKMPTAPWMKGPLLLQPNEVLDLSKPIKKKKIVNGEAGKSYRLLTDKVSGGRGKKAMKLVIESIEKLKESNNSNGTQKMYGEFQDGSSLGDIERDGSVKCGRKMPWMKDERLVVRRMKKEKVLTAAELSLDGELLTRLRSEAAKMRKWVKVKKAGVTQVVVNEVHSIWANNELVMFKFDLPLCRNMDRAREIVEIKTGGLVVWSKKDTLVAYRGCDYQSRRRFQKFYAKHAAGGQTSVLTINHQKFLESNFASNGKSISGKKVDVGDKEEDFIPSGNFMAGNSGLVPFNKSLYEMEADRLLDGLGPRFIDWWYPKPLPIDADLLPEVVPGFKPPFRLCPPCVRAKLTDDELTYLRKLAPPLPTHFVLGRNTGLQGLAVAILKLWEKSIIAKIAVKWGVPNTNNELMASELKSLTGGVLLLRNKFFIILFRGKDFLPGNIANLVMEREKELTQWHLHEEDTRLKVSETLDLNAEASSDADIAGTLSEFQHYQVICRDLNDRSEAEEIVELEVEKQRLEKELRSQGHKLAILKMKIERSAKVLVKLNSAWESSAEEPDRELITDEERECFRKIGLKMNRVLVLGRRGIFNGVLEALHQHWKHREVVKVITMQKTYSQVVYTATQLERESGGILVSVEKLKQGHAILLYRGKNYRRPMKFGGNLLDKRKALQRSLEMQRIGSLRFFAYQRERAISNLEHKLADFQVRNKGIDLAESCNEQKEEGIGILLRDGLAGELA
ncbi:hypothetical protein Ancab_034772 [Ancistrocladus abbreviatus]